MYRQVQDWEYAEESSLNDWQTVEIQIDTESEALAKAQEWANRTGRRVAVCTSIRVENQAGTSVEDRITASGDPDPIILSPRVN